MLEHGTESATLLPKGLRVIIADDMPMNRKMLSRVLLNSIGAEQWTVHEASSGEEVLRTCFEEGAKPDIVFMDENFGDDMLRGSDTIQHLRDGGMASLVISLTTEDAAVERCLQSGADAFWRKPFPAFRDGTFQRELSALCAAKAREQGPGSRLHTDDDSFSKRSVASPPASPPRSM